MAGRSRANSLLAAVVAVIVAGTVAAALWAPSAARAGQSGGAGFWEQVAAPPREKADRIVWEARQIPPKPENAAKIEALLRDALAVDPANFGATFFLAEVQAMDGRTAAAAATLEQALRVARFPAQKAQALGELALARTKLGQYREAIACYDRRIDLGDADAASYANAAELLMALQRLGDAEDRYRDAIRVDEQASDRREHEHGLALSYYGLGVALDRDGQPAAAREMIGRALALDPGAALLQGAGDPGSDVFFSPDGEVFYYLGLAWEVAGRAPDAEQAFRDFLARLPRSPWAARARAHLDALASLPGRAAAAAPAAPRPPAGPRWRVLGVATVASHGPLAAPLIDAAWKQHAPPVADCLAALPGPGEGTLRVVIDVDLDARGGVTRAAASVPAPDARAAAAAARCVEQAVQRDLQVTQAAHAGATSAHVEVLLGWWRPG
jgi:tetratricopeptide (TPR) repeat protein